MSAPLSPAAQGVDRAIADRIQLLGEIAPSRQVAAAALRAVADQVVPAALPWDRATCSPFAGQIRAEILAIAAELEGQP